MNTMQFLNAVLAWLQADPIHATAAAALIVSLTPTPNPSTTWGKVYKFIELVALNFGKAKETGNASAVSVAEEVAAILAKQQASSVSVTTVKAVTPASPFPVGITPTV